MNRCRHLTGPDTPLPTLRYHEDAATSRDQTLLPMLRYHEDAATSRDPTLRDGAFWGVLNTGSRFKHHPKDPNRDGGGTPNISRY